MTTPTLLGISGSLRAEATNRKLLKEAVRLFGVCSYTEADIRFPLYDGDLEAGEGIPEAVQTFRSQIEAADAILISTPEYNKAPSGALKNALDWVSRVSGPSWGGKPVAIMSAAAGRAGGERAQLHLRAYLVPFRPTILQGPEVHLADSGNQFDENGQLKGELYVKDLTQLMKNLRDLL